MNRAERQAAHAVNQVWVPNPEAHLQSPRDAYHLDWTRQQLQGMAGCSILDVGAYDGWLDFLLLRCGFEVEGVELVPELCQSAESYVPAKGRYRIHQGFFEDVIFSRRFDAVLCYEVLEHIPLDMVPAYISKMEAIATRRILLSLPDQDLRDNPQHLWTPSYNLILALWGKKNGFELTYKPYRGIPSNFMIKWDL